MSTTVPIVATTDAQARARFVRREAFIGIIVNSLISALFVFLAFGGETTVPLWGIGGLAVDFVPQTFAITTMTVLVATLITRKRVRAGVVPPQTGLKSRLPRSAVARALLFAAVSTPAFGGVATTILAAVLSGPLSLSGVFAVKIAYGACVAAVVATLALWAALRDPMPSA